MQGDDYAPTYPYVGSSDYADQDSGGGVSGDGSNILTSGCAECYNCLSVSGGGGGGLVNAVPKSTRGDYITENSWTLVGLGSFLIGLLGSTTFFFW